ncbi:MAG TPA: hypothetical protein PKC43_09140 [Phycisphaerales bacterium]|nr:hypothetical protein [Phycisphaerales bacterium]HMP37599.1 hypothetical protein [Phycisphaerales bacterium]
MTNPTLRIAASAAALAAFVPALAAAESIFYGPSPYLSRADNPIYISPYTHLLEDFEDGTMDLPGVMLSAGSVRGPSPITDSVDGDDGVIDGWGTDGHSWASPPNTLLTMTFNPDLLGGYPTQVGFVWTDGGPASGVTFVAFNPEGFFLGQQLYVLGDGLQGTTDDDRFIGISNPTGIGSISIINVLGELEIDHITVLRPVPSHVDFLDARPYLGVADSPFDYDTLGVDLIVHDFEDGTRESFGAQIEVSFIVGPGPNTDSVDEDTGAIDGNGNGAHSAAELKDVPVVVTFDPGALGGYPTRFGLVVTDLPPGPGKFRMRAFGEGGDVLGTWIYTVIGDDSFQGTTAEDRFIGFRMIGPPDDPENFPGVARVEITCLTGNWELDHIQYDVPKPIAIEFIDPLPYLSTDDIPFDGIALGEDYIAHDFEDGSLSPLGATISVSFLIPPSLFTDSVDADTGAIDGNGNDGHSVAELMGSTLSVVFDSEILGGFPQRVGIVVTDMAEGPQQFRMRLFGEQGNLLGVRIFTVVGDDSQNGTTDEDRFIGAISPVGIARFEVVPLTSNAEFDHVQYEVIKPLPTTFVDMTPYLGVADSPFAGDDSSILVVQDFESGELDLPGAKIVAPFLVGPGPVTDSVDEDTGAIDGNGNNGHSIAQLAGAPVVVTFDERVLGELPTLFGIVITDTATGLNPVRVVAYGPKGNFIGTRTYDFIGDASQLGTTAEDRFVGFTSTVGISRVEITCLTSNAEFDHVQFNMPRPPAPSEDLNGDGIVDGADFGILLSAWGTSGPGDLNGDGIVDGADAGILLAAWQF